MSDDWEFDLEGFDPYAGLDERKRAERVAQLLAESTASDAAVLRRALAEILACDHGSKSYYAGSCWCAGRTKKGKSKGCAGHVPEPTKIARKALGLAPLPDRPRRPNKP